MKSMVENISDYINTMNNKNINFHLFDFALKMACINVTAFTEVFS